MSAIAWLVEHHAPIDRTDSLSRIRSVLRQRGEMSRTQIEQAVCLSRSAVRVAIESAERRGIVRTWIVRNQWGTKTMMVALTC